MLLNNNIYNFNDIYYKSKNMKKDLNDSLDKFLNKEKKSVADKDMPKYNVTVKDGLYERIDEKTFLIEDGRQLLND
jgi:hypothetical protein